MENSKKTQNVDLRFEVLNAVRIIDVDGSKITKEVRDTMICYLTSYFDQNSTLGEDLYRLDDWAEIDEEIPDYAPGREIIKTLYKTCRQHRATYVRLIF